MTPAKYRGFGALTLEEQKNEFGKEFKRLENDAIKTQNLGKKMLEKVRNSIRQQAQTAYNTTGENMFLSPKYAS